MFRGVAAEGNRNPMEQRVRRVPRPRMPRPTDFTFAIEIAYDTEEEAKLS